ncbi:MAG TPA: hypothetical protein VIK45_05490 [Candidatus Dormibacteraeota bacterium]
MWTEYELELEVKERAAHLSQQREHLRPRTPTSLRVAVVLRSMADRLEARAAGAVRAV